MVRFGFEYASVNLIDAKGDYAERERKGSSTILDVGDSGHEDLLGDKTLGGETVWFAPDVDVVRVLVYPHVINGHRRGEGQVFEIDETEFRRDSQVENHVLGIEEPPNRRRVTQMNSMQKTATEAYYRLSWNWSWSDVHPSLAATPPAVIDHTVLLSLTH